ncbi:MAG: hypothetical protein SP1CHLAM54_03330 [Chlamydiia bacterium]|nr:hypothetical protein [Chlamydiia bacterium]MCH9615249.1 hypothetical protein [Chlamydiia bacterium]MCH9628429.1 hypothetical protein [Chlamydiia bacterium]
MALKLGFTPMAQAGIAMTAGGIGAWYGTTGSQKRACLDACLPLYRKIGVEHLTDHDLREGMWATAQTLYNVAASGVLFYIPYQMMHRGAGEAMSRHIPKAVIRGVAGNFASFLPLLVFYGVAGVAVPIVQDKFMGQGKEPEDALKQAQGVVILSASPGELALEMVGSQVRPMQATLGLGLIGTALVAARLTAGVLVNMQAVTSKETKTEAEKQEQFLKTWGLTSIFQYGIIGVMQATDAKAGLAGMGRYLVSGSALPGGGSPGVAAGKFASTVVQRLIFSRVWTDMSNTEHDAPWVNGKIEE